MSSLKQRADAVGQPLPNLEKEAMKVVIAYASSANVHVDEIAKLYNKMLIAQILPYEEKKPGSSSGQKQVE